MNNEKHETYCNYDLINLLIKLGFDWQDYFVAHDINEHFHWEIPLHIAQKWLREVKKLYIEIQRMPKCDSFDRYFTSIAIMQEPFDIELRNKDDEKIYISGKTYEQAQEAGIKKALEIILEKGK